MRKIKFRAWDLVDKKWFLAIELPPKQDTIGLYCYNHYPERYVYQQFTGLKDKNDKEIYEGDILLLHGRYVEGSKVKVEWCEVEGSDDMGTNMIGFPRFDEYGSREIIGNIFENPELLNVG